MKINIDLIKLFVVSVKYSNFLKHCPSTCIMFKLSNCVIIYFNKNVLNSKVQKRNGTNFPVII